MTQFPISLTEAARLRIFDVLYDQAGAKTLRVYVQGGGCSGFSYGFAVEEEIAPDDLVLDTGEFKVVIDAFSAPLLEGATLDYEEELMGSRFVVRNPNASQTCGCGQSFSI